MKILRKCRVCGVIATTEEEMELFRKDKSSKYQRATICKECFKEARKSHNINIDKRRDRIYQNTYGISLEDYNNLFKEQKGCCKICNTHQTQVERKLSIDHCHTTGRVRGLLCDACNKGIGLLKDNTYILGQAIKYLKDNK